MSSKLYNGITSGRTIFVLPLFFLFRNREKDMQENGLLYSAYSVTNFIVRDKWKIF